MRGESSLTIFRWGRLGLCGLALAGAAGALAQQPEKPSITVEDCSRLKGKAKSACQARADAANAAPATAGSADKFPFPEEQSKGTEAQRQPSTGDMPTSGVADPPAESMRPLRGDGTPDDTPAPSAGSSSSSSSSSAPADAEDDVAPTTSGNDTPVKAATLRDLGSHGDISAARTKLDANRVADDLKIGHFYLKDGNYAGASARYKDALEHEAENADAHFGLAQVLLAQGKRDEAAVHLRRYLDLAPDEDHSKEARKLLAKAGSAR